MCPPHLQAVVALPWEMQKAIFSTIHLYNVTLLQTCIVLESGLGLESGLKSIFAGLGLGLGHSDLERFVTKSTFNFHCTHFQCLVWAV